MLLHLLVNEHIVTEHQNVHFGAQEAAKCFRGFADDGFILVERRGIENYRNAGHLTKRFYQMTCHCVFIQQRLESRRFVRQVAQVEQRTIGGAGRGCVVDRPLR